ncbi:hypothetical protein ANCDUO_25613 [Ancylostoma duodenale]|uniref:Uncharacterized protein n=1 Tax=Ancylostoma duodenale TaxID=51022 RepID=A0A0C2C3X1_9BILA|nr:hypothetical protein ANCDUO_25613 [Ancylostoma duodenale]
MPARFLRLIIVVRPGHAQRRASDDCDFTPRLHSNTATSTRMDRKDIEDFLRRSNSICDQKPNSAMGTPGNQPQGKVILALFNRFKCWTERDRPDQFLSLSVSQTP